jgi:tRNA U34 2-thiouridine synthase MnmA/TrmU
LSGSALSERLTVGLSGGCDSVVLLHLLTQLGYTGRLEAIHAIACCWLIIVATRQKPCCSTCCAVPV